MHANNSSLILKHYLPARTDSDISAHCTKADVFHTGDTFWNRNYPSLTIRREGTPVQSTHDATDFRLSQENEPMKMAAGWRLADCSFDCYLLFTPVSKESDQSATRVPTASSWKN